MFRTRTHNYAAGDPTQEALRSAALQEDLSLVSIVEEALEHGRLPPPFIRSELVRIHATVETTGRPQDRSRIGAVIERLDALAARRQEDVTRALSWKAVVRHPRRAIYVATGDRYTRHLLRFNSITMIWAAAAALAIHYSAGSHDRRWRQRNFDRRVVLRYTIARLRDGLIAPVCYRALKDELTARAEREEWQGHRDRFLYTATRASLDAAVAHQREASKRERELVAMTSALLRLTTVMAGVAAITLVASIVLTLGFGS